MRKREREKTTEELSQRLLTSGCIPCMQRCYRNHTFYTVSLSIFIFDHPVYYVHQNSSRQFCIFRRGRPRSGEAVPEALQVRRHVPPPLQHDRTQAWLPDGDSQILRSYVFGPLGFWTMAPLRFTAKFDPFLSLDCTPPDPPPWRNPRKGRDQILPSGNLGFRLHPLAPVDEEDKGDSDAENGEGDKNVKEKVRVEIWSANFYYTPIN